MDGAQQGLSTAGRWEWEACEMQASHTECVRTAEQASSMWEITEFLRRAKYRPITYETGRRWKKSTWWNSKNGRGRKCWAVITSSSGPLGWAMWQSSAGGPFPARPWGRAGASGLHRLMRVHGADTCANQQNEREKKVAVWLWHLLRPAAEQVRGWVEWGVGPWSRRCTLQGKQEHSLS